MDRLIQSGRYHSPDSVVHEGLKLLQQRENEQAERQRVGNDLDRRAQEPTRTFDETTTELNAWRARRDGDDAA